MVCAPNRARNPKTPTWPAIPKMPTWAGILKEFRRHDGRASALTSVISAVVIFDGQTFRKGADFKLPISDGQLLNYEDTLLYVGGLQEYDGTLTVWMDGWEANSSLKRVFPDVFSGDVASESIFVLDGVRIRIQEDRSSYETSLSLSVFVYRCYGCLYTFVVFYLKEFVFNKSYLWYWTFKITIAGDTSANLGGCFQTCTGGV